MSARTAPTLPASELTAIAREAVTAVPGFCAKDLRSVLPVPLRPLHSQILSALQTLAAQGTIFRHVRGKIERFFAADPLQTLDHVAPKLLESRLTTRQWKAEVERLAPGHGALLQEWIDREMARTALQQLASEQPSGTLLLVHDLRRRVRLSKRRFDAAVLALSRAGGAVIHHHDHPYALSPAERAALVRAENDVYYIGIAPRASKGRQAAQPSLEERIRAAYLRVTGGVVNDFARLALLRAEVPNEPRDAVDDELRRMQQKGGAVLYPMDDPQRIRPEDDAAALRVCGDRRDLLCIKR